MNEKYMKLAIKNAKKALNNGDVPIGVTIIRNNKIISQGYNQKEKLNNAVKHAEIIAIERACRKLNTWHLEECEIYITMEPCLMCIGAIAQARIGKIVYSVKNEKFGYSNFVENSNKIGNHKINIETGILEKEAKQLLINFFENKRHKL